MANRTLVVGFDGSAASERALERAAALGGHGSVILVVAGPTIATRGPVPEPILDAPAAAERDALLERGLALLPDNGPAARTVSTELPAAEALMAVARDESASSAARAAAVDGLGLLLDRQPGLMLQEVAADSNFSVFPDWVNGMLTGFTL